MATKLDWGGFLREAGRGLSQYGAYKQQQADEKAALEREDRLLADNRAQEQAEFARQAQRRLEDQLAVYDYRNQIENENDPWAVLPGWGPTEMKSLPEIAGPIPGVPLWGGGMAEVPMPVRRSDVPGLMNSYWDWQTNSAREARANQPKPPRPSISTNDMLAGLGLGGDSQEEYFSPEQPAAVLGEYNSRVALDPTLEGNPEAMANAERLVEQMGLVPFAGPDTGGFEYDPQTGDAYNPEYQQWDSGHRRKFGFIPWRDADPQWAPTDAWANVGEGSAAAQQEYAENKARPANEYILGLVGDAAKRGSIQAKDFAKLVGEWGFSKEDIEAALRDYYKPTATGAGGGMRLNWQSPGAGQAPAASPAGGPLSGRGRMK